MKVSSVSKCVKRVKVFHCSAAAVFFFMDRDDEERFTVTLTKSHSSSKQWSVCLSEARNIIHNSFQCAFNRGPWMAKIIAITFDGMATKTSITISIITIYVSRMVMGDIISDTSSVQTLAVPVLLYSCQFLLLLLIINNHHHHLAMKRPHFPLFFKLISSTTTFQLHAWKCLLPFWDTNL